jgi:integrase
MREWRLGLIHNPLLLIRKPKPLPGRERRLSADEERKILDACDAYSNPMLGWMVRTALTTGMRLGEIGSLRTNQIDFTKRVVRLTLPKNGTARTVPLTPAATDVLHAAIANPIRPKDTDLIFFGEPGRDGKRRRYTFEKKWAQVRKDHKIADFHFHDLRHEAVSRLVEAGLSDQKVAAISGHKSMQMVRRYTHLRAEDLVAELDHIDAAKS